MKKSNKIKDELDNILEEDSTSNKLVNIDKDNNKNIVKKKLFDKTERMKLVIDIMDKLISGESREDIIKFTKEEYDISATYTINYIREAETRLYRSWLKHVGDISNYSKDIVLRTLSKLENKEDYVTMHKYIELLTKIDANMNANGNINEIRNAFRIIYQDIKETE